jgi:hypothetical protein
MLFNVVSGLLQVFPTVVQESLDVTGCAVLTDSDDPTPAVQAVYGAPEVLYHRCTRAAMSAGTYYLYAVNTGNVSVPVRFQYSARLASVDEAHACWLAGAQSAAKRPQQLGMVVLAALAVLFMQW